MGDIAFGLSIRISAVVTIFLILSACAWISMKKLGLMRLDQPFSAADFRTWSLAFATMDAVIYGTSFALVQAALGDGSLSVLASAFVATIIALQVVPAIARSFRK